MKRVADRSRQWLAWRCARWRARCCGRMRAMPARILAAQDEPAVLSDLQLNSALRNNQTLVAENIEAALAASDADLADSFVDLAREKNVPVADELARRVSDAVAEENSSSHLAKRFATGLVTGNADDRREPVGHGRRRPFRVRRHPRRGARRQAPRHGRGHRPAGARPCHRGPRGDGGDLCLGRRRRAGARRAHAGQGCPQGRTAGRGADAMGRPLGPRDGRCADAAAGGRVRLGAAAGVRP